MSPLAPWMLTISLDTQRSFFSRTSLLSSTILPHIRDILLAELESSQTKYYRLHTELAKAMALAISTWDGEDEEFIVDGTTVGFLAKLCEFFWAEKGTRNHLLT